MKKNKIIFLSVVWAAFLLVIGGGCLKISQKNYNKGEQSFKNRITISNQNMDNGKITAQAVVASEPGWFAVHTDSDGNTGDIIGYTQIKKGLNEGVVVEIDQEKITKKLYAMIHLDYGKKGVFEFPGEDLPAKMNGGEQFALRPFTVVLNEKKEEIVLDKID